MRSEIAMKDNEMVKLKMAFNRDTEEMKEEIKSKKKEIKDLIKKSENVVRLLWLGPQTDQRGVEGQINRCQETVEGRTCNCHVG